MKTKTFLVFAFALVLFSFASVSAADANGILQIFRNATTGTNVTTFDYNGNIYTLGKINISGVFYGNGSGLTDLNLAAISGALNGSGTYGYIPMWNGTSSLNNSAIYQNGTKIGIGTTTPNYKLEVSGTSRFSTSVSSPQFMTDLSTGTSLNMGNFYIQRGTDNKISFGSPTTAAGFDFTSEANSSFVSLVKFTIPEPATKGLVIKAATNQTANIQEWQDNASVAKLTVDNESHLMFTPPSSSIDTKSFIGDSGKSFGLIYFWGGGGGVFGSSTSFNIYKASTVNVLNSSATYSQKFQVADAGAVVGVGVINRAGYFSGSSQTLTIEEAERVPQFELVDRFTSTPSSHGAITWSRIVGATGTTARIEVKPDTGGDLNSSMIFSTNNGTTLFERMRVNGNGFVGINTTTPQNKLNVVGDANITQNFYVGQNMTVDSGTLFLNSNLDRIGISTTSPLAKLDVNGKIRIGNDADAAQEGMLRFTGTAFEGYVNGTWVLLANSSSGNTSGSSQWVTNGTAIYYNSGNVGIGTGNPGKLLDLYGVTDPTLRLTDSTNNVMTVLYSTDTKGFVGTSSDHAFGILSNNTERMTFLSNGNTGIGTTSPQQTLNLVGTFNATTNGGSLGVDSSGNIIIGI